MINPGEGNLLINTDDSFEVELNTDESVAFRSWESLDGPRDPAGYASNIEGREKRWGLTPWKFNVFTAYDFDQGVLKGFTVGGGWRWQDRAIIGETADGDRDPEHPDGIHRLMMRYRYKMSEKLGSLDFQINVYNLLDNTDIQPVRYSILDDPTSQLSRFTYTDPLSIRASVAYSF